MTKAICLPEDLVGAFIFKLRQCKEFDIPDQSSLQVQLEEVLKTQLLPIAEPVVTDVPATVDHSSHDANAATVTHQDETANTSQRQAEEKNDDGSDPPYEDNAPFSPFASQSSTPRTSPRNSPTSSNDGSPEGSPEGSPQGKSSELPKQTDKDVIKPNSSDGGISDSEPAASSKAASDETTPPLNIMIDAPSPEDYPGAASQEMVLPNETPDSPATEESLEPDPDDSSPASSVHAESIFSDSQDSISTEESFETKAVDSIPAPCPASRPQSRASSTQAFGDLSFQERWDFNWESETGGLSLGSQSMAAYASPVQNGHRVRTSCDSHEDPGRWRVYPDGFINEVSRAGGPLLCPLPYEEKKDFSKWTKHPVFRVLATWPFIRFVTSVMTKYNINPTSMELHKYEWCHNEGLCTAFCLMFEAIRDSVDDAWLEASREIWKYIQDHFESESGKNVSVEFIDPRLRYHPRRGYRDVSDLPLNDLSTELLGAIDTSEIINTRWCYLDMDPRKEDVKAFCLLVDYRSSRDWRIPREQMVAVLDKHNLSQVAIFITKRKNWGDPDEYGGRFPLFPRFG